MLRGELPQLGSRAIVPSSCDDLADDAGGPQPGQPGQVDGGLGVPGAAQDAAVLGPQREDVARPDQVVRRGVGSASSGIVRARSAALMPVVTPSRASTLTVNAVCIRSVLCGAICASCEAVEHVLLERDAEQPAAVRHREGDQLGRRELGGEDEVALVLAVLVVDDDDGRPAAMSATACSIGRALLAERRSSVTTCLPVRCTAGRPRRGGASRRTWRVMSTSRFTGSPGPLEPSVVRSSVVGMRLTSKHSGVDARRRERDRRRP